MITTFKQFNESSILRDMSFKIPEKKDWIIDGENTSIKFLGRKYLINPNNIKEFEENIGKTVSFKYDNNNKLIQNHIIK